jgi:hypothetical protein
VDDVKSDDQEEKLGAIFILYNLFCDGIYDGIKCAGFIEYADYIYDNIFTYNTINNMVLSVTEHTIIDDMDSYPEQVVRVLDNYCDSILNTIVLDKKMTDKNLLYTYLCRLLMEIVFVVGIELVQIEAARNFKNFATLFYRLYAIREVDTLIDTVKHLERIYNAYIIQS